MPEDIEFRNKDFHITLTWNKPFDNSYVVMVNDVSLVDCPDSLTRAELCRILSGVSSIESYEVRCRTVYEYHDKIHSLSQMVLEEHTKATKEKITDEIVENICVTNYEANSDILYRIQIDEDIDITFSWINKDIHPVGQEAKITLNNVDLDSVKWSSGLDTLVYELFILAKKSSKKRTKRVIKMQASINASSRAVISTFQPKEETTVSIPEAQEQSETWSTKNHVIKLTNRTDLLQLVTVDGTVIHRHAYEDIPLYQTLTKLYWCGNKCKPITNALNAAVDALADYLWREHVKATTVMPEAMGVLTQPPVDPIQTTFKQSTVNNGLVTDVQFTLTNNKSTIKYGFIDMPGGPVRKITVDGVDVDNTAVVANMKNPLARDELVCLLDKIGRMKTEEKRIEAMNKFKRVIFLLAKAM